VYVCLCVRVYVYVCMCVCVCMYVYVYLYVYEIGCNFVMELFFLRRLLMGVGQKKIIIATRTLFASL